MAPAKRKTPAKQSSRKQAEDAARAENGGPLKESARRYTPAERDELEGLYEVAMVAVRELARRMRALGVTGKTLRQDTDALWHCKIMFGEWCSAKNMTPDELAEYAERTGYVPPAQRPPEIVPAAPPSIAAPEPPKRAREVVQQRMLNIEL